MTEMLEKIALAEFLLLDEPNTSSAHSLLNDLETSRSDGLSTSVTQLSREVYS